MTDTTVQTVSISVTEGDKTIDITREVIWGWDHDTIPPIENLISEAVQDVQKVIDSAKRPPF